MPKLVQTVETETSGTLPELLAMAKRGDRILLHEGVSDGWASTPKGVIISRSGSSSDKTRLFLCGSSEKPIVLYDALTPRMWQAHLDGVVVEWQKKLWLYEDTERSPRLIAEDVCPCWAVNWSDGSVIVRRGNDLLRCVAGVEESIFYEGGSNRFDDWRVGLDGTLAVRRGRRHLLHGTHEVHKRGLFVEEPTECYPTGGGVFLLYPNHVNFYQPDHHSRMVFASREGYLDSCQLPDGRIALAVSDAIVVLSSIGGMVVLRTSLPVEEIIGHSNGIVASADDKLYLFVLNPPIKEEEPAGIVTAGMIEP